MRANPHLRRGKAKSRDFRLDGMPNPTEYALVKRLANAIDVLLTSEKYAGSIWEHCTGVWRRIAPKRRGRDRVRFSQ
jgi:hypothetical protein